MDKITTLVNEFDYLDVLSHAPDDEYEVEIKLIKKLLENITDPHESRHFL